MAKIIYFGTNGCSGHYPIGIDVTLTGEEMIELIKSNPFLKRQFKM